ncbi:MAG TPA: 5-formyltetrahydrofolate cyclo-ligase [Steroidobacteraceae bacterium]|nr:5-formyltetrahydrofolate cyclo-ligase [Steroidobacteraceae bacterium]
MLLWFESNGSHRHLRVTLPDPTFAAARKSLRAALRARRRALDSSERTSSAQRVARNADGWLRLRPGWRIALYASLAEELDTAPLLAIARIRGCRIYLPRIDRHRHARGMRFVEMTDRQRTNRLGICEPEGMRVIGARWLDVVFLPLVGFDARGVRLGAGGGYYDRAFSFRRWRAAWHTPHLVGLAYAFQQVEAILPAAHDVLLDAVITEKGVIRCTTG